MTPYDKLLATLPQKPEIPIPKTASSPYIYHYKTVNADEMISVQTFAELVAFINWVNGGKAAPLTAPDDHPQVF